MGLLKTTFYSGVSTTVSLVCKLITNKIVAVYLGTNGMFLLGQLRDFINIGKIASNFGTNKGIIKYVASFKDEPKKLNDFLITGFKVHALFSVVVCLLTFLFKDQISNYLFNDLKFSKAIGVLAVSFVTITLHGFFLAIFNGLKAIKTYVLINIISAIIAAVMMVVFVLKYNIVGAFYAVAVSQILIFLISLIFISKLGYLGQLNYKLPLDKFHFRNLTKFSFMAIIAPVCMIGATLFVRFYLKNELGSEYAGSWEGMWRISAIYIMFLTTTFQFYLLPTFSELSGKKLKSEVFKVWRLSFPTIIIITVVVYLLKDFIVTLLFSEEFLLINTIILFHLLGDALKINSWVLGNILVAKANSKVFVIFQIGWALTFCILSVVCTTTYGFVGISVAYFVTYLVHFLAMNIYFRKLLWIKTD